MDDRSFWALTFTGVLAMRCHPRNTETLSESLAVAHMAANLALQTYKEQFSWDGSAPSPPSQDQ